MYGKLCDKCKGPNHFKAICRSKSIEAKTVPSSHRKKQSQPTRRTSMGSTSGNGSSKHQPKQKTCEVTFKNPKTVLSGATPGGENGKVLQNLVLSGKVLENKGTYNRFSCYAIVKWLKAPTLRVSL